MLYFRKYGFLVVFLQEWTYGFLMVLSAELIGFDTLKKSGHPVHVNLEGLKWLAFHKKSYDRPKNLKSLQFEIRIIVKVDFL